MQLAEEKWMSEPPTESGLYFWREDAGDDYEPLLVHIGKYSSCVWLSNNTGTSFDALGGEWWPVKIKEPPK
jgi:hypothetical protein